MAPARSRRRWRRGRAAACHRREQEGDQAGERDDEPGGPIRGQGLEQEEGEQDDEDAHEQAREVVVLARHWDGFDPLADRLLRREDRQLPLELEAVEALERAAGHSLVDALALTSHQEEGLVRLRGKGGELVGRQQQRELGPLALPAQLQAQGVGPCDLPVDQLALEWLGRLGPVLGCVPMRVGEADHEPGEDPAGGADGGPALRGLAPAGERAVGAEGEEDRQGRAKQAERREREGQPAQAQGGHGQVDQRGDGQGDGDLLTWTGFANTEEDFADAFVGKPIQPFRIEDEARKLPNTNFVVGPRFAVFAVRDGRLITGQQQYSGGAAAKLLIEALGV